VKTRAPWAWVGLWAVGSSVEIWALITKKPEYTLSHGLRTVFCTRTPAGKLAFVGGWALLTNWLVPHILRSTAEAVIELVEEIQDSKTETC
jgi:hypothetical protein